MIGTLILVFIIFMLLLNVRIIVRAVNFKKDDWKHVGWLTGRIFHHLRNKDWNGAVDAWFWIKIHFKYPGKRIK
jgi:hypothetical protein